MKLFRQFCRHTGVPLLHIMKACILTLIVSLSLSLGYSQNAVNLSTDQAKSDIALMISTFEEVHYNPFFLVEKEDLMAARDTHINSWEGDSIPLVEFMSVGMKLAAMMSGGHSYMYWQAPALIPAVKQHSFLPFSGTINEDGTALKVLRSSAASIPIGTEVKTINGLNAVELFEETMTFTGGISAFRKAYCETMFPLFLFFLSELQPPYKIRDTSDEILYDAEGLSLTAFANFINSQQVQDDYTFHIVENNVGLISYNSCTNFGAFRKFLKKTFEKIHREGVSQLIIDIRENSGGDSRLNDLLLTYITDRPYRQASGRYWKVSEQSKAAYADNPAYVKIFGKDFMDKYQEAKVGSVIEQLESELTQPQKSKHFFEGATCFLIGPSTFSSANFLADAVKTYQLSTLIGQPTGEYTNDFGEQLSFELPHSGAQVFVSSTYDIGAGNDSSSLTAVLPDIHVSGDALKFALEWVREN